MLLMPSWNDVRLHEDRLHEFCYPLSNLCYKWTLICLVCTDSRSFHLCSLMTWHHVWHTMYDRLLASAAWWMPLVEQDLIYHLELLCRLLKLLNAPSWIDVIWLESKSLQNIKYILNTMTIWDQISIRKVGRQHLCSQNRHTEGQRWKSRYWLGTGKNVLLLI
jgi:hypothetical protein